MNNNAAYFCFFKKATLLSLFYCDSCFICSIVPIYNVSTSIVVFGTNLTSTVGIKFTRKQLATLRLCNLLLINIVL